MIENSQQTEKNSNKQQYSTAALHCTIVTRSGKSEIVPFLGVRQTRAYGRAEASQAAAAKESDAYRSHRPRAGNMPIIPRRSPHRGHSPHIAVRRPCCSESFDGLAPDARPLPRRLAERDRAQPQVGGEEGRGGEGAGKGWRHRTVPVVCACPADLPASRVTGLRVSVAVLRRLNPTKPGHGPF